MHYKKCYDANTDIYIAPLQIHSKPIEPGLPSSAALLINRPARDILPKLTKPPVFFDQDDDHSDVLIKRQPNADKIYDTHENIPFLSPGATVAVL